MFDVFSSLELALEHTSKHFKLIRKEKQTGLCLARDGVVVAACVYEEFNGSNIWLHCCGTPGTRWLTRDFLHWSFHYPFEQLGVERISLWVEADNLASKRFVEHLGFTYECTLQRAGREGRDVLIYRMFKEDCRHVREPEQKAVDPSDVQKGQRR